VRALSRLAFDLTALAGDDMNRRRMIHPTPDIGTSALVTAALAWLG
jgi:hypothetical protein